MKVVNGILITLKRFLKECCNGRIIYNRNEDVYTLVTCSVNFLEIIVIGSLSIIMMETSMCFIKPNHTAVATT